MTIDYIEKITLQEELKNIKEQLKTVQDENAKLKTDIDLYRKADTEKTEKIASLSEEIDILKYTNLVLRTNAAEEEVGRLQWEKDYLAKQVEHLQSCLHLENNKA